MLGVAKINWCFSVRLEHTFFVCSYIWLKNSGFRVLFTKPISTFFSQKKKKPLKLGLNTLFTHLKIILLQCF